jgi:hypothetical protein
MVTRFAVHCTSIPGSFFKAAAKLAGVKRVANFPLRHTIL